MYALIALAAVLLIAIAGFADRAVKLRRRARLRREAAERLAAAAAEAEAREQQRLSAQQASAALTSVMPMIHDHGTRRV